MQLEVKFMNSRTGNEIAKPFEMDSKEKVCSEPMKHKRELLCLHKQTSHSFLVPEYFWVLLRDLMVEKGSWVEMFKVGNDLGIFFKI